MNNEVKEVVDEKPLRFIEPDLYQLLLAELQRKHLHSYDMKASAIKDQTGVTLILRYGDELHSSKQAYFSYEAIRQRAEELIDYLDKVTEECKETIIRDYYKMLKPKKGEV